MGGVSAIPPADARSASEMQARVEAEREGSSFLLYRDAQEMQQLFFFEPGAVTATVGRQPPADLLLDWDDQVSRLHARFEWVNGAWELIDDGLSSNGTFVNGERLTGRRRLGDGDTLQFGTTATTFRSPGQGSGEQAEAPALISLSTSQRRVLTALCRPYAGAGGFATPATDEQIAEELFLSAGAVRTHLKILYAKLGVQELPQGETRVRLVERAFSSGLISERDL
jgi:pSer/pThr/pTyr-binding forkhead associated (FHA) protein